MTKLKEIIAEDKRKNNVMNDVAIDWKYLNDLVPQLLKPESSNFPEFGDVMNEFQEICDRVSSGVIEIKNIILEFKNTNKE